MRSVTPGKIDTGLKNSFRKNPFGPDVPLAIALEIAIYLLRLTR